jgi:FecR protein
VNWFAPLLLLLCLANSYAEPLQRARLRKVVGDYEQVAWQQNNFIRTGPSVRVELEFQDSTLVRIGSNASFRFAPGTRDMALGAGVVLLYATKKLGPVQLKVANVIVSGFDFMAYNVSGSVKVIALKRKVSVSFSDGSKTSLSQAQMLDIPRGAVTMPKHKDVNLDTLIATSLLGEAGGFSAFPGVGLNNNSDGGGAGYLTTATRETSQTTRAIEAAAAQRAAERQAAEAQAAAAAAAVISARAEADRAFLRQQQQQQQQEAAAQAAAQQAAAAQQQAAQAAASGGGGGGGGQGNQGGGGQGNNGNQGNQGGQGKHLGQQK